MNIFKIAGPFLIVSSFACQPPEPAEREEAKIRATARSSVVNGKRQWEVSVNSFGLSLAANDITVVSFTVGFTGCDDPEVTVAGNSAVVYSSLTCTGFEFKRVSFKPAPDAEPVTLAANGDAYTDASGNQWSFQAIAGENQATLLANFSSDASSASQTIAKKSATLSVVVDQSSEVICNATDPFAVSSDGVNKVMVTLNPPAGATTIPEGVVLTHGSQDTIPAVVIEANKFVLDFTGYQPKAGEGNVLTLGPFKASKGNNACTLTELQISINVVAAGGANGGNTPPSDSPPALSVAGMLDASCSKVGTAYESCSRTKPAEYWGPEWAQNAQVFTIVPFRRGVDGDPAGYNKNNWRVYDGTGAEILTKVIPLKQGVPTTIHFEQPHITDAEVAAYRTGGGWWAGPDATKDDVTSVHYWTAPVFFSSASWWKAESPDAEYRAETFNAFRLDSVSGGVVSLSFVPMEAGTYDGWCQFGGPGDHKALKAAGNTPLTYTGGHPSRAEGTFAELSEADKGMVVSFVVSADADVSLAALDSSRNTFYNGHDKGSDSSFKTPSVGGTDYTGQCFWGKCDTSNAPQTLLWAKAEEPSDAEFVFKRYTVNRYDAGYDHDGPATWVALDNSSAILNEAADAGLDMYQGYPHIVKIESAASNQRNHSFEAPDLFKKSVFRKAMDSVIQPFADYFSAVAVRPGKWTSFFVVPMEAGTYGLSSGTVPFSNVRVLTTPPPDSSSGTP